MIIYNIVRCKQYLKSRVGIEERHDDDGHDGEHEDGENKDERPDVDVEVLATKLDDLQHAAQSRDADDDREQRALHLLVKTKTGWPLQEYWSTKTRCRQTNKQHVGYTA